MQGDFYYEEERELNLFGLFKRTLLRWRGMLICAVIFALLGCGYKYFDIRSEIDSLTAKENQAEPADQTEEENTNTLDQEELKEMSEYVLSGMSQSIESKYEYITNSVLGKLNSSNSFEASSTIYINVDESQVFIKNNNEELEYKMSDGVTTSIIDELTRLVSYAVDYDTLAQKIGLSDGKYATELVTSWMSENNLIIRAVMNDKEKAQEIVNYVTDSVMTHMDELKEVYGDFEAGVIYNGAREFTNYNDLWLRTHTEELNALVTSRTNFANNAESITTASASSNADAVKQLSGGIIKKCIKYGIVFGALGFFGYAFIIILYLILSDKVLVSNEVSDYYKLTQLMSLPEQALKQRKVSGLDKKILSMGSKLNRVSSIDESYKLCLAELNALQVKADNIAIIGDISDKYLKEIANRLEKEDHGIRKYTYIHDVINSAAGREQLTACDGVILVNKIEDSSFKSIEPILSLIKDRKLSVIGTISL